jgi:ribosomal protein L11 methyltransferase
MMEFETKKDGIDLATLRQEAFRMVANASAKITPVALEKRLSEELDVNKKQIKSVIRDLVAGGELAYTYEYGSTYLEPSFARPVRVSTHIVLQPPGHRQHAAPDDVVVKIKPGASFGIGNHPTTRLALQGIDVALWGGPALNKTNQTRVLDIGTGSGVLLVTALLCGVQTGLGVDIDACARAEAAGNVRINGLDGRATISGQPLADIHQRFSVIAANLRLPGLKKMQCHINERADTDCFLILSGIREDELDDLTKVYERMRFETIWAANERGWAGVVMRRIQMKKG